MVSPATTVISGLAFINRKTALVAILQYNQFLIKRFLFWCASPLRVSKVSKPIIHGL
jgi:hypothetical protein